MAAIRWALWLGLLGSASAAQLSELSVRCGHGGCSESKSWSAANWTARASLDPSQNETGWATLFVETAPGADDPTAAFAAGYAEGFITAELILASWRTLAATGGLPSVEVQHFAAEQVAFAQEELSAAPHMTGEDARYWLNVALVYEQLRGLGAGYNAAAAELHLPGLNESQILWLNLQVEFDDIQKAVDKTARPDYTGMEKNKFYDYVRKTTHCTAIFRVTPELDDMFAAHTTWWDYSWMLRIFKAYKLRYSSVAADTVLLSSFPGFLSSTDDFYVTSQKLAIIETSNEIFNNSLFDLIKPASVPYWVRNTVANRLAHDGKEWHDTFYRFNSGTYNNQWMVADYKKFIPRQPLPPWTFSVSEQLPGRFSHPGTDLTMVLQRGHWASYNVPYFEDVYRVSGYPEMVSAHGVEQSYQLAPRAKIFRRDAERVNSLKDLQEFMRLNAYGTSDPLATSPWFAIAGRGDLKASGAVASGAIDAKAVSTELMGALAVSAVAGPTTQGQPPFAFQGRWSAVPHFGAPEQYDFDWQTFSVESMGSSDNAASSALSQEDSLQVLI